VMSRNHVADAMPKSFVGGIIGLPRRANRVEAKSYEILRCPGSFGVGGVSSSDDGGWGGGELGEGVNCAANHGSQQHLRL
jgi:hypothetical protein